MWMCLWLGIAHGGIWVLGFVLCGPEAPMCLHTGKEVPCCSLGPCTEKKVSVQNRLVPSLPLGGL